MLIQGESGTGKELIADLIAPPHAAGAATGRSSRSTAPSLPREPAGERAVRPRARRVHRRQGAEARAVRGGRRRHAVPRRGRRDAAGDAGQAAARAGGDDVPAPRRHARSVGRRARRRRDQQGAGRRGRARARFAWTSTTGWTCSTSACRRCASGARTSCRWRRTSWRASRRACASRRRASRPRPSGCCAAYDYPGNVRELRNVIERAVILSDGEVIDPDCIVLSGSARARARAGGGHFFAVELDASGRPAGPGRRWSGRTSRACSSSRAATARRWRACSASRTRRSPRRSPTTVSAELGRASRPVRTVFVVGTPDTLSRHATPRAIRKSVCCVRRCLSSRLVSAWGCRWTRRRRRPRRRCRGSGRRSRRRTAAAGGGSPAGTGGGAAGSGGRRGGQRPAAQQERPAAQRRQPAAQRGDAAAAAAARAAGGAAGSGGAAGAAGAAAAAAALVGGRRGRGTAVQRGAAGGAAGAAGGAGGAPAAHRARSTRRSTGTATRPQLDGGHGDYTIAQVLREGGQPRDRPDRPTTGIRPRASATCRRSRRRTRSRRRAARTRPCRRR